MGKKRKFVSTELSSAEQQKKVKMDNGSSPVRDKPKPKPIDSKSTDKNQKTFDKKKRKKSKPPKSGSILSYKSSDHKIGASSGNSNKEYSQRKPKTVQAKTATKKKPENTTGKEIKVAPLPKSDGEFSSNWKQLQAILRKENKSSSKRRPVRKQIKKADEKVDEQKDSVPEIWFDDVDDIFIDALKNQKKAENKNKPDSKQDTAQSKENPLVKSKSFEGLTKVIAMDCEMVGTGADGIDSILARVSVVNQFGHCVYDKYVKPIDDVTDYRTHVSGIRQEDLVDGEDFKTVQKDVHDLMKGRILVGHALQNDFKVLFLDHPRKMIRDTSQYKPFRRLFKGRVPSLKKLTAQVLSVAVQEGEHNSVQDAQAAMRLYTVYRPQWEKQIKEKRKQSGKSKPAR